jgi:polyribonucleotide nucleotidyltransferase
VHISKLGGGKRINQVEDVLQLGQELEVRVDEIDDKGKISLVPVGDAPDGDDAPTSGGSDRTPAPAREERSSSRSNSRESNGGSSNGSTGDVVEVSFEDSFDAELADELGDLGPASERPAENTGGGRRNDGGRRRHR